MHRYIKEMVDENELTREEINELNDDEYEKFTKNDLFYKFSIDICSLTLRTSCVLLKLYGIYLVLVCLRYFFI